MTCNCEKCNHNKSESKTSGSSPKSGDKWRYSLYTLALVLIVFSPFVYGLTHKLLKATVGCAVLKGSSPTLCGKILHSIVFLVAIRYMMDLNL